MEHDRSLQGNDRIEAAIEALQREPTEELLAHALTVFRRRMNENGHLIAAVDQQVGGELQMRMVETADKKTWFAAFTGFDEQRKGSNPVMSAFTAEIRELFQMTLDADGVAGLIVNPWNRTIMLDKQLIRIILGEAK